MTTEPTSFNDKSNPEAPTLSEATFEQTLKLSTIALDKLLEIFELLCRSLLELVKTFSKIFLTITCGYAILIWRHYPAEEPRTLIMCWCASLVAVNLGEKALDGYKAPPMTYHLSLLIVAYLFPVKEFSALLQAF